MTKKGVGVIRNGQIQTVDIDQITDDEFNYLSKKFPKGGWIWARFLAHWIKDNVSEDLLNKVNLRGN